MSLGFPILIPSLGRYMVPFHSEENPDFFNLLDERLSKAEKTNEPFYENDVNFHIINELAIALTDFLREKYEVPNNEILCLNLAGKFCQIVKNSKPCSHDYYIANLKRLIRICKKLNVNIMHTGLDQYIARMVHLMKFEDPIRIWDSYALWFEDIRGNEEIFE